MTPPNIFDVFGKSLTIMPFTGFLTVVKVEVKRNFSCQVYFFLLAKLGENPRRHFFARLVLFAPKPCQIENASPMPGQVQLNRPLDYFFSGEGNDRGRERSTPEPHVPYISVMCFFWEIFFIPHRKTAGLCHSLNTRTLPMPCERMCLQPEQPNKHTPPAMCSSPERDRPMIGFRGWAFYSFLSHLKDVYSILFFLFVSKFDKSIAVFTIPSSMCIIFQIGVFIINFFQLSHFCTLRPSLRFEVNLQRALNHSQRYRRDLLRCRVAGVSTCLEALRRQFGAFAAQCTPAWLRCAYKTCRFNAKCMHYVAPWTPVFILDAHFMHGVHLFIFFTSFCIFMHFFFGHFVSASETIIICPTKQTPGEAVMGKMRFWRRAPTCSTSKLSQGIGQHSQTKGQNDYLNLLYFQFPLLHLYSCFIIQ